MDMDLNHDNVSITYVIMSSKLRKVRSFGTLDKAQEYMRNKDPKVKTRLFKQVTTFEEIIEDYHNDTDDSTSNKSDDENLSLETSVGA